MYMRMRARSFDRRPSYWFICGLLARKMWMKEGGGGENGSALLFGASLALRLWLARRRENLRGGVLPPFSSSFFTTYNLICLSDLCVQETYVYNFTLCTIHGIFLGFLGSNEDSFMHRS